MEVATRGAVYVYTGRVGGVKVVTFGGKAGCGRFSGVKAPNWGGVGMVVTGVAAGVVVSKIGDRETWGGGGGVERRCLWVVGRLGWSDAAIPATEAHDMEVNKAASIWVIRDISPCIATRAADVSADACSCLSRWRRMARTSRGSRAMRCSSSGSSSSVVAARPSPRARRSRDVDRDLASDGMVVEVGDGGG
jgi:hypothetical protein